MSNGGTGFGEVAEVMLPGTFLLKAAKETLKEAALFGV
jgi:hypothetical protein